jgi:hypothetical protein
VHEVLVVGVKIGRLGKCLKKCVWQRLSRFGRKVWRRRGNLRYSYKIIFKGI